MNKNKFYSKNNDLLNIYKQGLIKTMGDENLKGMKKSIYYWSPCLTKVATIKATMNSAISLARYTDLYDVKIINVCGEWTENKNYLLKNHKVLHFHLHN